MFTGLIFNQAKVIRLTPRAGGIELAIEKPSALSGVRDGDSIAVNGVCLTVKANSKTLLFDVIPETLRRSNLGSLTTGDEVNVEPSLRVGDAVGGHWVRRYQVRLAQLQQPNRSLPVPEQQQRLDRNH